MRPCEHGRHNQADAFAAARRRITQNMLWSIVAKRVDLRAVRPFTDVNSFLVDQASLLDVRALRPACAARGCRCTAARTASESRHGLYTRDTGLQLRPRQPAKAG